MASLFELEYCHLLLLAWWQFVWQNQNYDALKKSIPSQAESWKILPCQVCCLPENSSLTPGSDQNMWCLGCLALLFMWPHLQALSGTHGLSWLHCCWGGGAVGEDKWATGVTRSLDRKGSLYSQEHLFNIAYSPSILVVLGCLGRGWRSFGNSHSCNQRMASGAVKSSVSQNN